MVYEGGIRDTHYYMHYYIHYYIHCTLDILLSLGAEYVHAYGRLYIIWG